MYVYPLDHFYQFFVLKAKSITTLLIEAEVWEKNCHPLNHLKPD